MIKLPRVSLAATLVLPVALAATLSLTVGHRWSEQYDYTVTVPTTRDGPPLKQTRQRRSYFAGWPLSYFGSSNPSIRLAAVSWLNLAVDIVAALAITALVSIPLFLFSRKQRSSKQSHKVEPY